MTEWLCRATEDLVYGGRISIRIDRYRIVKRTPKGVWIEVAPWSRTRPNRFVLNTGRKRFAYPTLEEALESLKARKQRQLEILQMQTAIASATIDILNRPDFKVGTPFHDERLDPWTMP